MNDAIRGHKPLTMTVLCKSCGHQYGAWRPRCEACGTATPPPPKAFNPPKISKRQVLGEVTKTCRTQCTFCRQRGAHERCKHCNELIHRSCFGLHEPECIQFQRDRASELARLSGGKS